MVGRGPPPLPVGGEAGERGGVLPPAALVEEEGCCRVAGRADAGGGDWAGREPPNLQMPLAEHWRGPPAEGRRPAETTLEPPSGGARPASGARAAGAGAGAGVAARTGASDGVRRRALQPERAAGVSSPAGVARALWLPGRCRYRHRDAAARGPGTPGGDQGAAAVVVVKVAAATPLSPVVSVVVRPLAAPAPRRCISVST